MKSIRYTTSVLAIAAFAVPSSAIAATDPVQAQTTAPMATQPDADADDAGIRDIIVTAQKRPESSQKTPLVITTIDPELLASAHIDGATDLQRVVPNLTAQAGGGAGDPGGGNTLFTIRGLGASATGPQGSTGVAAHFDGVYRQDGISNSEFFDLERIEVSPGPQGTLYGRSAAAGAINIIPAKPELGRFKGAASLQIGNYGTFVGQGMLNIPIGTKAALRFAGQKQTHDGYYTNGYDALEAFSLRGQLLIKPTDELSIRVAGNYTELSGVGAGNVFVGGPALPGLAAFLPQVLDPDLRKRNVNDVCVVNGSIVQACRQDINFKKYSVIGEISYDFGPVLLTLIPAYVGSDRVSLNANAPSALSVYNQTPYKNDQTNFEARLNSTSDDGFQWVVGGNYYKNEVDNFIDQFISTLNPPGAAPLRAPFVTVTSVNAFQDQKSSQSSYAVFAQGTYPVLDTVRLTLGARYNWDESQGTQVLGSVFTRFFRANGNGIPLFSVPGLPVTTPPQTGSASFRALTYRAAIDVDVGPRSLIYGSISTGYKPGSLNDGGPRSSTPAANPFAGLAPEQFFGPERVTHFEAGTKNRFFNNTLQVNAAAYYDDYSNYQNGQTQVVNPLQFGALGFVVTNAGKARVYGAELAVKWQPSDNDSLDVSANYLNTEFTRYDAPAFLAPGNLPAAARSFAGFVLPNAPRWSGTIAYRHTFDLGEMGTIDASAYSRITEGYWVYFAQTEGTFQKAHTSTTLDLRFRDASSQYSLAVFVKNIEDRDVKVFGGFVAGYSSVGLAPPRTIGAEISVKF